MRRVRAYNAMADWLQGEGIIVWSDKFGLENVVDESEMNDYIRDARSNGLSGSDKQVLLDICRYAVSRFAEKYGIDEKIATVDDDFMVPKAFERMVIPDEEDEEVE